MRGAIHRITILTPAGSTRSAEGQSTATFTPETVDGRAMALTDQEQWVAAQRGYTSNVGVLVPRATPVAPNCEVIVAGTGELGLDGRYKVIESGGFQTHQRLLLQSFQTPETATAQTS